MMVETCDSGCLEVESSDIQLDCGRQYQSQFIGIEHESQYLRCQGM